MFKKLFGPFPDEPLLYCLDKILGLLLTFDITDNIEDSSNTKTENSMNIPTNEIDSIKDSGEKKKIETVSENNNCNVTTDDSNKGLGQSTSTHANEGIRETSHTSAKQHNMKDYKSVLCEDIENKRISVDITSKTYSATSEQPIKDDKPIISNDLIDNDTIVIFQNISPLRKLAKKTSSMECLYSLSETKIESEDLESKRNFAQKEVEKIVLTKKAASNSNQKSELNKCLVKKLPQEYKTQQKSELKSLIERSVDRKINFEPYVKEKSTYQYLNTLPNDVKNNFKQIGKHKERTIKPGKSKTNIKAKTTKLVSGHPKVIKTEWACTRIHTFEDDSQTYEIMTKDNSLPLVNKTKSIQRIFAISPNSTTVAYRPVN